MLSLNPYHAVAREDLDGSVVGAGVLVAAQAASIANPRWRGGAQKGGVGAHRGNLEGALSEAAAPQVNSCGRRKGEKMKKKGVSRD